MFGVRAEKQGICRQVPGEIGNLDIAPLGILHLK